MTREISVIGGSVQLLIEIGRRTYYVDVWNLSGAWRWTAKREGARRYLGDGMRARWSEARTAAFKACLRESKS